MNNRLGYIDAIRGFAMLLVVYGHVNFFSFKITPSIGVITESIQMPIFFFISGYVAFKANTQYSFFKVVSKLWDKFKALIIPATLVGLGYTYLILGKSAYDFSVEIMKYGYWFSFSLFTMNVIYLLTYWAVQKKGKVALILTLSAVAVILWGLKYVCVDNVVILSLNKTICLWHTFTHFPFFVLGVIVSLYRDEYERVVSNNGMINTILLVLFIMASIMGDQISALNVRLPIGGVHRLIVGFCGSLLTLNVSLFYKSTLDNLVGRLLQFIGQRSLDIYLLHYFLLPDLTYAARYVDTSSTVVGLAISSAISILIIVFSLCIGNIIRMSPVLASFLLGVKYKKHN
jgi:peptidoglycan/LPS O-acetylase OafA/YrhL